MKIHSLELMIILSLRMRHFTFQKSFSKILLPVNKNQRIIFKIPKTGDSCVICNNLKISSYQNGQQNIVQNSC